MSASDHGRPREIYDHWPPSGGPTDKGRILGKYRLDVAAFRQQRQRLAAAANA
jgi:hypothetical protein